MRFTLIKDLKKEQGMKNILQALLFFILLYLIANLFVKALNFGLTPESVAHTLFGDEENFIDPLSKASFLEFIHTEIFFIMMISFTLSAVYIRVSAKNLKNTQFVNLLMFSGLGTIITLGLSYFVTPKAIIFYLGSFYLWNFLLAYMTLYGLWRLFFAKSL